MNLMPLMKCILYVDYQGFNRIIAFSRPFYFCVCGLLVLILHYAGTHLTHTAFTLYGMPFTSTAVISFAKDLIISAYFSPFSFF